MRHVFPQTLHRRFIFPELLITWPDPLRVSSFASGGSLRCGAAAGSRAAHSDLQVRVRGETASRSGVDWLAADFAKARHVARPIRRLLCRHSASATSNAKLDLASA